MKKIWIPLEGQLLRIIEEIVEGGSYAIPKSYLGVRLVIENEWLGIDEKIPFLREGAKGDVLSSLIEDFENIKDIRFRGQASYKLPNPLFRRSSLIKDLQALVIKDLQALVGITDWKTLKEEEKKKLKEYIETVWPLEITGEVLIEGSAKYGIEMSESGIESARISLIS